MCDRVKQVLVKSKLSSDSEKRKKKKKKMGFLVKQTNKNRQRIGCTVDSKDLCYVNQFPWEAINVTVL